MTLRLNLVNLAWEQVSGSSSYDILLDNVKVSRAGPKAKTTKINIPEGAEHKVTIKAQPSGQVQEARFEWASLGSPIPPPPSGDLFAAPNGLDTNPGTLASPFLTFRKLTESLQPGQVGMLRAGNYGTASTYQAVNCNGTSGNRITITNYPGESVTVRGYVEVEGSYVTISNLHIDNSNSVLVVPSKCGTQALGIVVRGSDVILEYNEIYQTGNKGSAILPSGDRCVVRYNKIHDIGFCYAFDHGVYIGDGTGSEVCGNWIWNNPHGWGVQIYPAPNNGRFYRNVIDACGSGFVIGDDGSATCTGNEVFNNVVLNSVGMRTQGGAFITGAGITGAAPQAGTNNSFHDNCCYGNPGGVGSQANVSIYNNITANPQLADVVNHDYRPTTSTPAAVLAYGLPTFVPGPTI